MLILTIRTDKPEAELGLYQDYQQLAYITWPAHRQLAETLHGRISELLKSHNRTLHDLQGIACYRGPGSFTGLRIGLTVGNALAYALALPIVGAEAGPSQDDWLERSLTRLLSGDNDNSALPEYGADVNVTRPVGTEGPDGTKD